MNRAHEKEYWGLVIWDFENEDLKLVVLKDSSFANNQDMSIQLRSVTLLEDVNGRVNVLRYSSYK